MFLIYVLEDDFVGNSGSFEVVVIGKKGFLVKVILMWVIIWRKVFCVDFNRNGILKFFWFDLFLNWYFY